MSDRMTVATPNSGPAVYIGDGEWAAQCDVCGDRVLGFSAAEALRVAAACTHRRRQ